ncbi:hypothetical protein MTYM_01690 [Methylococcales bacterium]|nr:hypothetical protein MTYM_01690 [Methylococcales bacterium]
MTKLYSYTYAVLRYMHDITTGEFVNVGVVLYAPEARFANAKCRSTYGRLTKVFPGANGDHFKSLMHHIQKSFEVLGEQIATQLPFNEAGSVLDLAKSVLPNDDSALQWSPMGGGRTPNPSQALEQLYERMVMRYEERHHKERRTDDDVWRHFKRNLEARNLLGYFEPKKIAVQDDEVEFQHAWKNGVWHCIEPISFDLSAADSIKDKAHRWLGQIASVQTTADEFRLYLLLGEPQEESLRPAFNKALSILKKMPVKKEIVLEHDALEFVERIECEIKAHEDQAVQ